MFWIRKINFVVNCTVLESLILLCHPGDRIERRDKASLVLPNNWRIPLLKTFFI